MKEITLKMTDREVEKLKKVLASSKVEKKIMAELVSIIETQERDQTQ